MASGALSRLALTVRDLETAELFYGPVLEFMGMPAGKCRSGFSGL
jgi:hypothetical protein